MPEPADDNTRSSAESWLPDIEELFEAVERDFGVEEPATYQGALPLEAVVPAVDRAAPYVRAAAVLASFDAETIKPLLDLQERSVALSTDQTGEAVVRLLSYCTLVVGVEGQARWSLRDSVRRAALTELLDENRIQAAVEANESAARDDADPVQRMLVAVLTGSLKPLDELREQDLTALQQVAPWMEGLALKPPFPPPYEIRQYLELERLLDPFRHLIGHWEDGAFVEHFRGRTKELSRLRSYVDVADPQYFAEFIGRSAHRAVRDILSFHQRPPLVIHGPGGVGKSTLMAKFLLQHFEAYAEARFPFAYVDLDRPDISVRDPLALLPEVVRQLAIQYADRDPLSTDWSSNSVSSESADRIATISDFEAYYHAVVEEDRPLVFVLDTLEVVQQFSRDRVRGLFKFLNELQSAVPRLRTVLAGRAPVTRRETEFRVDNLELADLDNEAALGFLASCGIADEALAQEIVGLVGRQPLALKLAADLVSEHGLAEVRQVAAEGGVLARLRSVWTKTDVAGRLYERLLLHITDQEVRKLAHPGLVLRYISPEIIQRVLAKPCDLELEDDAAAHALFERLREQVSLVAPSRAGVLRHRADVRRMMLPLILEDDAKASQIREIQDRAVDYYASREGTAARAEEIYHRLLRGDPPRDVDDRWVAGLDDHLGPVLDELPKRAQAFVAARINAERSDAVWLAADVEDWECYAERRIRSLLSAGQPATVQEVLELRSDRTDDSRLPGLQALALAAEGKMDEARGLAKEMLVRYQEAGAHPDLSEDLRRLISP